MLVQAMRDEAYFSGGRAQPDYVLLRRVARSAGLALQAPDCLPTPHHTLLSACVCADPAHIHDFMPSSQDLVFDCIRVTWVRGGGGVGGVGGARSLPALASLACLA